MEENTTALLLNDPATITKIRLEMDAENRVFLLLTTYPNKRVFTGCPQTQEYLFPMEKIVELKKVVDNLVRQSKKNKLTGASRRIE